MKRDSNIIAYADIANPDGTAWRRVAFSMDGRAPICTTEDGKRFRCPFLPDLHDDDELLWCLTRTGIKYGRHLKRVATLTDWENRSLFTFKPLAR